MLHMQNTQVYDEVRQYDIWYTYNDFKTRTMTVRDKRNDSDAYAERPMTDSDVALCAFAEPDFSNFSELWRTCRNIFAKDGVWHIGPKCRPLIGLLTTRFLARDGFPFAPASPQSR